MQLEPVVKQNLNASVKAALNELIGKMSAEKKTKLPPEIEIAKSLNVSRATLRGALNEMEQEGTLLRIHGKGTFINPEATQIKLNLSTGYEFGKMIRSTGYRSRVEVIRLDLGPASSVVAVHLQIAEKSPVYVLEKLYYADDHPAIISVDRFAKSIFPEDDIFTKEESKASIFDILRNRAGRMITRDLIVIQSMDTQEMKKHCDSAEKMECSSCLSFHGINYDQNNLPVIYDTEFYDTNYVEFSTIRQKSLYE